MSNFRRKDYMDLYKKTLIRIFSNLTQSLGPLLCPPWNIIPMSMILKGQHLGSYQKSVYKKENFTSYGTFKFVFSPLAFFQGGMEGINNYHFLEFQLKIKLPKLTCSHIHMIEGYIFFFKCVTLNAPKIAKKKKSKLFIKNVGAMV